MLEPLTFAEVAAVTGGKLEGIDESLTFNSVSTDTRTLEPGALFVALKGENFDGHSYVPQALAKGALAVVVSTPIENTPCIEVGDTLAALQAIARLSRENFTGPVVGVTGSVGKTTTKDMLALALSPLGPVHKTPANLNNEIGLPLTILTAPPDTKALVLEMGMRGLGQIAELAMVSKPTVGVITGIGVTHMELLGSKANIANAKGELFEALNESGVAIYPATDEFAAELKAKSKAPSLTVALDAEADIRATNLKFTAGTWDAEVTGPWEGTTSLHVPSPGRFNVQNALLAIAAATHVGVDPQAAAKAIEGYSPGAMRLETLVATSGATVLSDCYNAAPDSMSGALETLMQTQPTASGGKRIAVLGEMRELGEYADEGHALVGRAIAKLKPEMLVLVGAEKMRKMSAAAIAGGFSTDHIHYFDSSGQAATGIKFIVQNGDVVLVKGSRGVAMESIVEALVS
ncbi:MAG: UDP-N-acetylmuramoyl-tripeptide--D-alanyl-D-alanine ligase [Armatimonas sp.]